VNFTTRMIYPLGKSYRHPSNMRMGGPPKQGWMFWRKFSFVCQESGIHVVSSLRQRVAWYVVRTVCGIYCLHSYGGRLCAPVNRWYPVIRLHGAVTHQTATWFHWDHFLYKEILEIMMLPRLMHDRSRYVCLTSATQYLTYSAGPLVVSRTSLRSLLQSCVPRF
jgi:hypothetical protein